QLACWEFPGTRPREVDARLHLPVPVNPERQVRLKARRRRWDGPFQRDGQPPHRRLRLRGILTELEPEIGFLELLVQSRDDRPKLREQRGPSLLGRPPQLRFLALASFGLRGLLGFPCLARLLACDNGLEP